MVALFWKLYNILSTLFFYCEHLPVFAAFLILRFPRLMRGTASYTFEGLVAVGYLNLLRTVTGNLWQLGVSNRIDSPIQINKFWYELISYILIIMAAVLYKGSSPERDSNLWPKAWSQEFAIQMLAKTTWSPRPVITTQPPGPVIEQNVTALSFLMMDDLLACNLRHFNFLNNKDCFWCKQNKFYSVKYM